MIFEKIRTIFGNYYISRGIRVIRVSVLAFTIYGAGYRSGVTDFIENPDEMHQTLLNTVVSQSGSLNIIELQTSQDAQRIHAIGHRIIDTAKLYCKEQLEKAKTEPGNGTEVEYWQNATRRVNGNWTIKYLDAPTPNAFVSNLLPRHIFIHEGLIKEIKPSDEELALILAHEISHLIHNHSQNLSILKGILAAVQLISFVFVDPTGGLWFYFFDIAFGKLENFYYASFSRDTEIEADLTGIQIAAKACYETRNASKVFLKFSEYHGQDSSSWSWTDSHPSDASREEYLRKESEVHNPEMIGSDCHHISQLLQSFKKKIFEHETHSLPVPSSSSSILDDTTATAINQEQVESMVVGKNSDDTM